MLTGACLSRAGFNRHAAYATLTMLLAAEAADCDVLWSFKGHIAAFQHHRGITHSFFGAPFVAAATLGFVYLLHRLWLHGKERRPGYPPVRWRYLYLLALLAALSHLLLDYTTAFGIRLFEPFDYRWFSWDIVFIIEPLILAVLALGLAMPALFGLVNREIGARAKGPGGRAGAIVALLCVLAIWGFRDFQHRRALGAINSLNFGGQTARKMAAYPYVIDPFRWHGVVETQDMFQTFVVDSSMPKVDPAGSARTYYKPEETPVTLAAKQSRFGSVYLDWAAFPLIQSEELEGEFNGFIVHFQDLRYAYAGRGALGGFVLLDRKLTVAAEGPNGAMPAWVRNVTQPNTK